MASDDDLIPALDWLAASGDVDDSWLGPGPNLTNVREWMERLAGSGHRNLVAATFAAASVARRRWDEWLARSPDTARESLLESRPPTEQLAAVARWLESPTQEHKALALDSVDLTKQLHWFHEEYSDVWFDEPGMWAVESSEHCVLTLAGDPNSDASPASLATISLSCAVNSLRSSDDDDIRESLRPVVDAIRRRLRGAG
jgi:hypothetical protein